MTELLQAQFASHKNAPLHSTYSKSEFTRQGSSKTVPPQDVLGVTFAIPSMEVPGLTHIIHLQDVKMGCKGNT